HEKGFGPLGHGGKLGIEQQRAQGGAQLRRARLCGGQRSDGAGQSQRLGRLAAAVDSLEGDEPAESAHAVSGVPFDAFFAVALFFAALAVVAFFAAFLVVFLADLAALVDFEALAALPARFTAGPAARRSASSSAARSMVMVSGSSPLRNDALVVPS